METFLSPLAPRSRVRDVIHALLGARQLETFVVEGKTLLHVGGDLPAFAAAAPESADSAEPGDAVADLNQDLAATAEDGSRIRKYTPKPGSKIGTGLRTKPAFGARSGKPLRVSTASPILRAPPTSRTSGGFKRDEAHHAQAFLQAQFRQALGRRSQAPSHAAGSEGRLRC